MQHATSSGYLSATSGAWRCPQLQHVNSSFDPPQFYVPWNFHERSPGVYKWDGEADVERFLDICQSLGLNVSVHVLCANGRINVMYRLDILLPAKLHYAQLAGAGAAAAGPLHLRRVGLWWLPLVAGLLQGKPHCPLLGVWGS